MARVLGYGVGNTNGARDFTGKTAAVEDDPFRHRLNQFNRRRFAGLWRTIIPFLMETIRCL